MNGKLSHYVQAQYDGKVSDPNERVIEFLKCWGGANCGGATIRREDFVSDLEWQLAQEQFTKKQHPGNGCFKNPPSEKHRGRFALAPF